MQTKLNEILEPGAFRMAELIMEAAKDRRLDDDDFFRLSHVSMAQSQKRIADALDVLAYFTGSFDVGTPAGEAMRNAALRRAMAALGVQPPADENSF